MMTTMVMKTKPAVHDDDADSVDDGVEDVGTVSAMMKHDDAMKR